MTNGEKIIVILKPRKDQIRIYDNWVEIEIQKLGINFSCEQTWWNAEYKEPNTKFQEKIANAKSSTWLTDGLTEEEVKQIIDDAKEQAKRDCKKCKHRIPTVDIVKGKPIYGCEKWECEFEPKGVEE